MNINKWPYAYISIITICFCINILIFINILPFDTWRFDNLMVFLSNIILVKGRKLTNIEFVFLLIWLFTQLSALFKHIHFLGL